MEGKSSPFGNVCGIHLRGTMQDTGRIVQLVVHLVSDAGLTVRHVVPKNGQQQSQVAWGEMGDVTYQMRLEEDGISEVIVLLSYFHDVDERTLMASVVVHFVPHGWVKLKDAVVPLDRDAPTTELEIPGDIVEEKLNTTPRSNDNIESIYGRRLANRDTVLKFHNHFEKRPRATNNAVVGGSSIVSDEDTEGVSAKKIRIESLTASLPSLPLEFNTFAHQQKVAAERELAYSKEVAGEWEQTLRPFIRGIFGDPFRVREIVRMWHRRLIPAALAVGTASNPSEDADRTSPSRIFYVFMNSILHAEKMLEMTETHVYFFNPGTAPSLGIPLNWLTTEEQIFCNRLYVNRARLFQRRHEPDAKQYRLSRCWLDKLIIESAFCSRFIVHQFAIDCADCALRSCRPIVLLTLISATGRLYVKDPRDPFVARLKMALEKPSIERAIEEMGMFVRIGLSSSCRPDYEAVVWRRGQAPPLNHRTLTPYRLTGGGGGGGE